MLRINMALKFGDRKRPPVTHRRVYINQCVKTRMHTITHSEYVQAIKELSQNLKGTNLNRELRSMFGSLIWPAHQTRPYLCF